MLTLPHAKNRRGVSLVEMSIVLAVVGGVLGAIWVVSSNVREEQRDNDAVTQLQTVVNNIITLKQTQGTPFAAGYPSNITTAMINAGAIPRSYVNASGSVDTPWAKAGFITWALAARTFRVSFYSPSTRGCVKLLLQATACTAGDLGCPISVCTKSGAYIYSPTVGTNWTSYNASLGWKNMSPQQAATACGYNTASPSVEFDYTF